MPLDAIENLVLADGRCNGDKGDSLAATDHVVAWAARLQAPGPDLAAIAAELGWESSADRALGPARSIYLPITPDALLWTAIDVFVAPDKPRLRAALG